MRLAAFRKLPTHYRRTCYPTGNPPLMFNYRCRQFFVSRLPSPLGRRQPYPICFGTKQVQIATYMRITNQHTRRAVLFSLYKNAKRLKTLEASKSRCQDSNLHLPITGTIPRAKTTCISTVDWSGPHTNRAVVLTMSGLVELLLWFLRVNQ